jgi:hypothetical protein
MDRFKKKREPHTVTEESVAGSVCSDTIAMEAGQGVHKKLLVEVCNLDAVYLVINHEQQAYRGKSLKDAVAAYNAI